MKVFDLSHPITHGIPSYTGGIPPKFESRSTFETRGRISSAIYLGSHTGTHVDAPLHFIRGGLPVAQLPLERVMGMATLVDVSKLRQHGRLVDSASFLEAAGNFPVGDIALIYTGFDQLFGSESFSREYPILTLDSIRVLIQWQIRAFAIDTISVDAMNQPGFENHKALLGSGIPIVECVTNVLAVRQKRFFFAAFPLKLVGLEGSPCRAIAITDCPVQGLRDRQSLEDHRS